MSCKEDKNMNKALVATFTSRLPATKRKGFEDTTLAANPQMISTNAFDHFLRTYGKVRE